MIAWVPPRMLSSPLVQPAVVPPEPVPPVVVAFSVWLSPITETALPPMVTGTLTGMIAWVPPRMLSSPVVQPAVVPPSEPEPAPPPVVVAFSLVESPITETALPPMVTGTFTETMPWVPDSSPSSPEVSATTGSAEAPLDGSPPAGAEPPDVSASVDELSPTTETALPATVTGALTVTTACEPDAAASSPDVVAVTGAGAGAGADVVAPSLVESPITLTALPPTVTGRSTSMRAWVPESSPSSPSVVSSVAFATVAPSSVMPPASTVPSRARVRNAFMMKLPLS